MKRIFCYWKFRWAIFLNPWFDFVFYSKISNFPFSHDLSLSLLFFFFLFLFFSSFSPSIFVPVFVFNLWEKERNFFQEQLLFAPNVVIYLFPFFLFFNLLSTIFFLSLSLHVRVFFVSKISFPFLFNHKWSGNGTMWKWNCINPELGRETKRVHLELTEMNCSSFIFVLSLTFSIISFPSLPFPSSLSLSLSLSSLLFIDVTISVFHENNLWKLFARDSQIQLSMEKREGEREREKWESWREGEDGSEGEKAAHLWLDLFHRSVCHSGIFFTLTFFSL